MTFDPFYELLLRHENSFADSERLGNNPVKYVDPDGREDIQPTALMGQKAHRLFFETLDIIKTKEDPSSLKIFDSRLSSIKAWLGIALNPRQNPALDSNKT